MKCYRDRLKELSLEQLQDRYIAEQSILQASEREIETLSEIIAQKQGESTSE